MSKITVLFLFILISCSSVSAEKMTKIVYSGIYSDGPVTIYKAKGESMVRRIESVDSSSNEQQMIIYNGEEIFVVNLFNGTGEYTRINETADKFNMPIFSGDSLKNLWFGNEFQFVTKDKSKINTHPKNSKITIREMPVSKNVIKLLINNQTNKPIAIEHYDNSGSLEEFYEYLEYDTDLELVDSLFERPTGINFIRGYRRTAEEDFSLRSGMRSFFLTKHDTTLLIRMVKA
ncbi:MAG: hypothetical protein PF588_02815, partial [Candidatus Kapabacteria bacterium]|nr:hypothetical protein [Candidatus Kapabacteria bacterium]